MNSKSIIPVIAAALLVLMTAGSQAMIMGVQGPNFQLMSKTGYITTPEGGRVFIWGFSNGNGTVQYIGPTLIINQGDLVTVDFTNTLDVPSSIVFPGQTGVTSTPVSGSTSQGLITLEALPGGTVRYQFTATHAGTYMYHSGTQPELQTEMGLVGAIIIRPTDNNGDVIPMQAYEDPSTAYDREYLFFITEMDPKIHELVETGRANEVDNTKYWPVYWFLNGRCAPDTMWMGATPWLPTQPYNCMPMMHPGERMLMRVVGGDRDTHPYHHHGNNSWEIARNGRVFTSGTGEADNARGVFTIQTVPGGTTDAIFEWTGANLGWDIYGHEQDIDRAPTGNFPGPEDVDHNGDGIFDNVPLEPNEYAPDHGKPFPVQLPDNKDLAFGGMYSGSPFLGAMGDIPVGEGGMNPNAGYTYMWHSHTEKEMVNNDIFPGGNMTMMMVVPHGVMIMH